MKGLHKKISVGVLVAGVLVGSGLSQGFVAHANYSLSSDKRVIMKYEDFENYKFIKSYEEAYRYEAKYLKEAKKVDLKYSNRWDLLRDLKSGKLNKYREKDPIIIQIENSHFEVLFNPFYDYSNQHNYSVVRWCAYKHNLKIILFSDSKSLPDVVEMNARIRSIFSSDKRIMNKLLGEPSVYYKNAYSFEEALRHGDDLFKGERYIKIQVKNLYFVIENLKNI